MAEQTCWNGQPCKAQRVRVVVADNPDAPAYWARDLIGQERAAVEVHYFAEPFYLDNEDGSGWAKVTHGGSPQYGHRNLSIEQVVADA